MKARSTDSVVGEASARIIAFALVGLLASCGNARNQRLPPPIGAESVLILTRVSDERVQAWIGAVPVSRDLSTGAGVEHALFFFAMAVEDLGLQPGEIEEGPCGTALADAPLLDSVIRRDGVDEDGELVIVPAPEWALSWQLPLSNLECLCPEWSAEPIIAASANAEFREPISLRDGSWLAMQLSAADRETILWRLEPDGTNKPTAIRIGALSGLLETATFDEQSVIAGGSNGAAPLVYRFEAEMLRGVTSFIAPEPEIIPSTNGCLPIVMALNPSQAGLRAVLFCGDVWEREPTGVWRLRSSLQEATSECGQPVPRNIPPEVVAATPSPAPQRFPIVFQDDGRSEHTLIATVLESGTLELGCVSAQLLSEGGANPVEFNGTVFEGDGSLAFGVTIDRFSKVLMRRIGNRWSAGRALPISAQAGAIVQWYGIPGVFYGGRSGAVRFVFLDGPDCGIKELEDQEVVDVMTPMGEGFVGGSDALYWFQLQNIF